MFESVENLARENIRELKPYRSARSLGYQGVYLDANENPSAQNEDYCRYPEPQPKVLVDRLSQLYGVLPQQLLVTRGCDEGIDLLIRTFCEPKVDAIIVNTPTYGMYQVASDIQDARVIKIKLQPDDYALDLVALQNALTSQVKIVFICSPNNPTGNVIKIEDMTTLCAQLAGKALLVVDEAYIEFSQQKSLVNNIQQYPNLVVLRTLSKAYGLAGLRLGAVLANEAVIALLRRVIAPYPIPSSVVNMIQSRLVCDVSGITAQREQLVMAFSAFAFVRKVFPSEANFLLLQVTDAADLVAYCRTAGVIIRDMSQVVANAVRISVGVRAENQLLLEVLNDYAA